MRELEVRIDALRLRAIIGCNSWERQKAQDVIVRICFRYDGTVAIHSDDLTSAVDYKTITKSVIEMVENSSFQLLETLASAVYDLVFTEDMSYLDVVVEKPHALRFSDSVSVRVASSYD